MTKNELYQQIEETAAAVHPYSQVKPKVGMILGSGLGKLVDAVEEGVSISYDKLPHMAASTVKGHAGRFVIGHLSQQPVIVMQGRLHAYEGYSMGLTTFPVRVMRALGAEILIVTNAAGGINPAFQVGDIMRIVDHINFLGMTGRNPLWGPNDPRLGPRFLEMSNAYDPAIGALADNVAQSLGFEIRHGIYIQLGGPSFETPAEIRFLQGIGGDAVGMSTAAEVVVARHGGMRVLGFSHISNIAIGEQPPLGLASIADPHGEVLEAGQRAIPRLVALIQGVLERLDEV